jgi:hypothetical protein
MSDRAITGRDVIGDTVIERRIVPAPIRREKPPPLDLPDGQWREAMTRTIERMQQAMDDATRPSRQCPLFAQGGHLTEEISFTSGTDKVVSHGLGRKFEGCLFLVAKSASAVGFIVDNDTNAKVRAELDKVQVTISPTATFTGRLWIF